MMITIGVLVAIGVGVGVLVAVRVALGVAVGVFVAVGVAVGVFVLVRHPCSSGRSEQGHAPACVPISTVRPIAMAAAIGIAILMTLLRD